MVRDFSGILMESTFYEDNSFNHKMSDVNRLKRNLTLDLDSANNPSKRPKYSPMVFGAPVLSSPDVKRLKLTSPEIEKFILAQNNLLTTPTPSTPHTQLLFPKSVTEEHDLFFQNPGLADALNELQNNSDSSQSTTHVELPKSSSGSSTSGNYIGLDAYSHMDASKYGLVMSPPDNNIMIKEEPHQIVPSLDSSPPMSPINMESQERIKLERKRMRNRVAASKCRKRKLERISKLEDKVKCLKGENNELSVVVIRLKEEVCRLKQKVLEHVQSGCDIMITSNFYVKSDT